MRWPHRLDLLLPTLLVAFSWLLVSGATTIYIAWIDRGHERVISENVSSLRAAFDMQNAVAQMQLMDSRAVGGLDQLEVDFRNALMRAHAAALSPDEQSILGSLDSAFEQYLKTRHDEGKSGERNEVAREIARLCGQLHHLNGDFMDHRMNAREVWSARYRSGRMVLVIIGPMVGMYLGYRMSRRIGRRIADLQFSLAGVSDELGSVRISETHSEGDLADIEAEIQTVAQRIHEVVNELNTAQQQAQHNERLAAIGQLAAGVAHGLRNPLTAVKLLVQTLSSREALSEQTREYLQVIQDEVHRMERTIQSLLDFAKPPPPQRASVDARALVARARNLVRGRAVQSKIEIQLHTPDAPVWILADQEQLHQILVNLLLNGMDAMPNGGSLRIDVRVNEPCDLPGSPRCVITVSDEGAGVESLLLDRIFDPFVTTKAQGSGLGLAISRRFAEEHGGTLTACNGVSGGAIFELILPGVSLSSGSLQPQPTESQGERAPPLERVSA
jgi:signal transduction histidine kinase